MAIAEQLQRIADKQQLVYNAGFTAGSAAGGNTETAYNQGLEDGKQAEYDKFWDAYQNNGNRENYERAFAGIGWNVETFKPKYNIVPKASTAHMFALGLENVDLVEHLSKLGITLDFSQCSNFTETFYSVRFKRIGIVDTRSATNLTSIFSYPSNKFETIDLLVLREDGTQTFGANSFRNAAGLKNITIDGVISSDFDIRYSPLTKASIEIIVRHLSATASGKTVTFSKSAVNSAFTTDEWTTLIQPYSNWTISLV